MNPLFLLQGSLAVKMLCFRILPRNISHFHKTVRRITNLNGYITKDTQLPVLLSFKQNNVASCQRFYSATNEPEEETSVEQETQTGPIRNIYTFPNIKQASLVSKLKIFQTVAVSALVPTVYGGFLTGTVSYPLMLSSMFIMGTSTISLYLIGDVIRRIVCIMKYNDDTGEVYIAHINFWGRRRNVAIPVSNFVPISDSKEKLTDTYIKLDTYDKSESFLIFLKHCSEEEKNEVLKLVG